MQKKSTVNDLPAVVLDCPVFGLKSLKKAGLLYAIMKVTLIQMTVAMIFSGVSIAFENHAQEILKRKVSLELKDISLMQALSEIEKAAKVKFVYSPARINLDDKISLDVSKQKLGALLSELLTPRSIKFKVQESDDYIVLIENEKVDFSLLPLEDPLKEEIILATISGRVIDTEGNPMPGVNIIEKGTTNGTTTDVDGIYSLVVSENDAVLVFSFIGYTTQEVTVNGRSVIDVTLVPDAKTLEEIVVIGYGEQKKVNMSGAVSTVNKDLLNKRIATQTSQFLQGAVSGITVTQGSGEPGSDQADIVIRGLGTFSGAGNNPLVIVDGVPSSLNSVSPNDVESISVLKDAASASIYGSRAANGVILITTKKGEKGKLKISYDSYVGKQEATSLPQYVNSWTYAEMLNEARNNVGRGDAYTQEEIEKYRSGEFPDEYANKQHVRDLFTSGNGLQTRHNLSFNGTEGGTQYLLSTGYLKQNGIVERVDYGRFDFRLNLTSKVRDNLKLSVKLSGNSSTRNEPAMLYENNAGGFGAILRAANSVNATVPGKKSDGTYGTHMGHPTASAGLDSDSFQKSRNTFFVNIFSLEWDIVKSLKFTNRIGYDWAYNKSENFGAMFSWDNQTVAPGPSKLQVNTATTGNITLDSYFDYDKTFGKDHFLHVLGGFSYNMNNYESLGAYRENSPSTQLHVINAFGITNNLNSGSASTSKLISFFGRVNYRFQEKYLLEGNLRYDGSSRFPKNTRFGLFPSFSAAWNISNEDFFNVSWIDNLKIRSSYGTLGNQQIGTYPYQKTLNLNQPYPLGEEERLLPGIALTTLPFQNITWESVAAFNQGIDINLFNSKINLSVDHYNRKTFDILYNLTVSSVLGMNVSSQNAGEVINKGWDFELAYRDQIKDFSYSIQPNFSINHNEVLSLAGVDKDISKGLFVGKPLGSVYGYKTDGLFVDQGDIDSYAVQNYEARPGLIRYKDISGPDGEPDGIISAEYDRTVIANTFPKYSYGMGLTANYKGIDFYMQFQGLAGYKKRLSGLRFAFFNNGNIEQWQVDNRWTEENPDRYAKYPKLIPLSSSPEVPFGGDSEYWLEDASFLRIKTLQLGYNIPSKVLDNTFIDQFRVYVSGQNLMTLDHFYQGWDPEMATGGYANSNYYPPTKLWIVGINVNF